MAELLSYLNKHIFRGQVYIIFDTSGSTGYDIKQIYKKIYDYYNEQFNDITVIKHSTVAKISNIEEVMNQNGGGTYMSSGLLKAYEDLKNRSGGFEPEGNIIIQCCDGDNWSEDKEVYMHLVKEISKNNLYVYYETLPPTYTTTMINKVSDINKANPELKLGYFRILKNTDLDKMLEVKLVPDIK